MFRLFKGVITYLYVFCSVLWALNTTIYLVFSVFTSTPVSVPVDTEFSVILLIKCMLAHNILICLPFNFRPSTFQCLTVALHISGDSRNFYCMWRRVLWLACLITGYHVLGLDLSQNNPKKSLIFFPSHCPTLSGTGGSAVRFETCGCYTVFGLKILHTYSSCWYNTVSLKRIERSLWFCLHYSSTE
jgi:hypothetical protein